MHFLFKVNCWLYGTSIPPGGRNLLCVVDAMLLMYYLYKWHDRADNEDHVIHKNSLRELKAGNCRCPCTASCRGLEPQRQLLYKISQCFSYHKSSNLNSRKRTNIEVEHQTG